MAKNLSIIKDLLYITIKLVLVAVIAGFVAYIVGVKDYVTVGVIAILCISISKKDSIIGGIKRYLNALIALLLSSILFVSIGFDLYVFIIFLIIFIFVSFLTDLQIGIVPSIVLVNHLYQTQVFTMDKLIQEFGIITVAVLVSLLLDLIYPSNWFGKMKEDILNIDHMLKDHLFMLTIILTRQSEKDEFIKHQQLLNEKLEDKINAVELKDKNKVFGNDHRYLAYVYMRRNQLNYINHMYKNVLKIKTYHPYQEEIALYIKNLIPDISDQNKAIYQKEKLLELIEQFRKEPLPNTRQEFETRALLYSLLEDIDSMLEAKEKFHIRYPEFKI